MSEDELHSSSDKEEERIHTATRPTNVRAVIARLDAAIERCRTWTSPVTRSVIDAISSMGRETTVTGSTTPASLRLVPISLRSGRRLEDGDEQELAGRVQATEWMRRRAADSSDEAVIQLHPRPSLDEGHVTPYAGRHGPQSRNFGNERPVGAQTGTAPDPRRRPDRREFHTTIRPWALISL